MTLFVEDASNLSTAITRAVVLAQREGYPMQVRDVAHQIARDAGLATSQETSVIDALCNECIRNGVIVEFRPA